MSASRVEASDAGLEAAGELPAPIRPVGGITLLWGLAIVAALVPVALLGLHSYQTAARSVKRLVQSGNVSAATVAREMVGRDLQRSVELGGAFASLPGVIEAVEDRDEEALRVRLKAVVESYTVIDRAFVTDRAGVLWADYPKAPESLGQNFSGRDWYRRVSAAWQPVISEVYQRRAEPRRLVVAVATPIRQGERILGILVYQYRLDVLGTWLRDVHAGDRGTVYAVDGKGAVVAHPRAVVQSRPYVEFARLDVVREALAGREAHGQWLDPLERQWVVGTAMPMTIGANRWVVVAQQPAESAYAPIAELRAQISLGAGVLAALGLAGAVGLGYLGRRQQRLGRRLSEQNDLLRHVIAQRRQAQEALSHERNLLRTLIDNIPDRIYVKDSAGRYLLDNEAHRRLLGLDSAEQLVGRTVYDFFPADLASRYDADDRAVLESGQPLMYREERMIDPGGGPEKWLLTTKVPLRNSDGRPMGTVGISRDITPLKAAEAALLEKNRQLQAAVEREQAALAAMQLAQAQMVQTEKLASLGQLVAGVAHEINNPLAFVTNNVAVLQRDFAELRELVRLWAQGRESLAAARPELAALIGDLEQRIDVDYLLANLQEVLGRSREGLRRIQQIVKDLRDFARQDTVGDLQRGVDLNAAIESSVNIARGRARKQGVDIRLELADLPLITCFAAKVNQVILNLLINAIDACSHGGTVTVRSAPEPDGRGVWIEVSDTGHGIDPAIRDRIFDPFFTTKPQGQGMGLGLSISHGIVQDHGGRIQVESAPGQGARFTVHLPLAPECVREG